jgi:hypothetical protein
MSYKKNQVWACDRCSGDSKVNVHPVGTECPYEPPAPAVALETSQGVDARQLWTVEDVKTGRFFSSGFDKPSDWITGNPAFKVSLWREAHDEASESEQDPDCYCKGNPLIFCLKCRPEGNPQVPGEGERTEA